MNRRSFMMIDSCYTMWILFKLRSSGALFITQISKGGPLIARRSRKSIRYPRHQCSKAHGMGTQNSHRKIPYQPQEKVFGREPQQHIIPCGKQTDKPARD